MTTRMFALRHCCLIAAMSVLMCRAAEEKPAAEKGVVKLSAEALKIANLELVVAGPGTIETIADLPGEVTFNTDHMARVAPRASGIVSKVLKSVGDKVKLGEPLAVIESVELGNAKIEYFTAKFNLDIAAVDLEKATTLHSQTVELLDALKRAQDGDSIDTALKQFQLGDTKTKLLNAFTALKQARSAAARNAQLKKDNLATTSSVEVTSKELDTARADFAGIAEQISTDDKIRLMHAERAFKIAENPVKNTERRLRIFGINDADIAKLPEEKGMAPSHYELKAPISGVVTERPVALGDYVSESSPTFTVVDLSTMWVNLQVYSNQLDQVKIGQVVNVRIQGQEKSTPGKIAMMLLGADDRTHNRTARVAADNPDGQLVPSLLVTGAVVIATHSATLVVPAEAIQSIDGKPCVFVAGAKDGEFVVKALRTGITNGRFISVEDGLKADDKVVGKNSFVLKADLLKGADE